MSLPPSPAVLAGPGPAGESVVARRRRDEIVRAATDIIAGEGLHRLSLSRIEQRAGMSRGQLTYYFRTKEAILLAVFDRMLSEMIAAAGADAARGGLPAAGPGVAAARLGHGLGHLLARPADAPPAGPQTLGPLVHTFMAQAAHRPDYRAKLAEANAGWRAHIAADVTAARPRHPHPPAAVASVVMAVFQGLGDQLAVDPAAFDRAAVLAVCVAALSPFLAPDSPAESGHE